MDNVEIISAWFMENLLDLDIGVAREMASDLASRLNGGTSASLNTTAGAKAASHPTRRAILRTLWTSEHNSPKDIAEVLDAPLGTTSYHLRMLKDYGSVEVSHTAPRRGALQHFYQLTEEGRQLCLELYGPEPT